MYQARSSGTERITITRGSRGEQQNRESRRQRFFVLRFFSAFGSNKIDADLVAEFLARPSLSVPSIPKPPACVHHVHYLAKERETQPRSCTYLVSAHLV